jgi:hypothetical protein
VEKLLGQESSEKKNRLTKVALLAGVHQLYSIFAATKKNLAQFHVKVLTCNILASAN